MPSVDVTIIAPVLSPDRKRKLATRLSGALASLDGELGDRTRWLVVAEAVRSAPAAERDTAKLTAPARRRGADLDYTTWHAHLAGTRRWAPNGDAGAIA
jgi:hypothetical protein